MGRHVPSFFDGFLQKFLQSKFLFVMLSHQFIHLSTVRFLHCVVFLTTEQQNHHLWSRMTGEWRRNEETFTLVCRFFNVLSSFCCFFMSLMKLYRERVRFIK